MKPQMLALLMGLFVAANIMFAAAYIRETRRRAEAILRTGEDGTDSRHENQENGGGASRRPTPREALPDPQEPAEESDVDLDDLIRDVQVITEGGGQ